LSARASEMGSLLASTLKLLSYRMLRGLMVLGLSFRLCSMMNAHLTLYYGGTLHFWHSEVY